MELEHRAYWALRLLNFDESLSGEKRRQQLLELEEMRLNAMNQLGSTSRR